MAENRHVLAHVIYSSNTSLQFYTKCMEKVFEVNNILVIVLYDSDQRICTDFAPTAFVSLAFQ